MDFSGRTLLLTGASGGIGREVARIFYAKGANLVLTDLDKSGLDRFIAELAPAPGRVVSAAMDSASPTDCDRVVKLAGDTFGGIDFLIPSAGIYKAQPVRDMTDEQ